MAYAPEQVQFLVPKLSTGNSPFSLALIRQQSALASVHTGDRDPYDPFSPSVEQTGSNRPFTDIELGSNDFQIPSSPGSAQFGNYSGDNASSSFLSPSEAEGGSTYEPTVAPESSAGPTTEQRFAPEAPSSPENNSFNPSGSSASNRSAGGGGSSAGAEASSISASEADTPTLSLETTASGTEDGPISIDIDAALTDPSEVLTVTISNIPEGSTLSAGTVNPDGTVTLTADELDGLTITPPENYSGSFDLEVTATSTDGPTSASVTDTISVTVEAEADAPTLDVADAAGTEDTAIALDIDAGLTDAGEVLSVTVSNIPEGASLSAGTVNPDGTVTLTADELDGLTITPPADYSGSFDLGITATSTDGTDTASVSDTISVSVEGEADAPTLNTSDATGTEDNPIALDIDAGLTDSGEVLSVTVSNIPEGATLSAGTVNPDGTVTLTADELDGLTITPPADYSGSFDLGVTATSTDGTDTASVSDTLTVDVTGEADAPTLDVADAIGTEDSPIALDIDAGLTDSGEVLSVTVSNIPEGATLSAGTVNPDGTVTLTADELDGLTITPPADYSGSFDLGVTATSTDGTDTASVSDSISVSVEGEADAPALDVTDASGTEDTAIALDIDAGLTDSGEVLSVTVSNIPEGATLSAGTVNPDGTVTLTADELDGLTITPPADYSGSFDLGVTATSTDGTDTASVSDSISVSVEGEADAPALDVTDASGTEDTAIALDIDAGLTDSGEVLSITVSNIPEGATLSAGTVNPDGTVTLTADELDGLTITPPADYSGSFDLGVTATSTDGTDTASVSDSISVSVEGEADAPTLGVTDATGTEDTAIALEIDAGLTDSGEVLSVTVSNIPEGATLSAGTVNPDGTVTLTADELDGLTITPPTDYSGSFDLGVTATSADGTDTASVSDTLTVDVTGEADAPTLDVADATGTEDTPIALDIDAGLTDSGEVLSVTVSNIPEGATLSAGTVNPDGTVTLTADELDGLTITPPTDYSGSFDLGVTATSADGTDTASVSDTLTVDVTGEADTPTLDVADAIGTEDSPIALDIDAGLTDSGEVLSVTVSNIPEGATLSAGTVNPDGTVTLTADELNGLTITPPADYSGSFDLGVTATSADGTDTASVSDTLTVDVTGEADAPTLDVADAIGTEDSPIALDIDAGLTDSGEVLSVTVSNIPEGATLSAGTVNPDGTVTLTADELDGLTITPPADYSGSFDLGVTATSTDGTDTASVSDSISVSVEGEADAPALDVTDASGTEDTAIALDIDAGLTDSGEVLSITVSNIPEGATLSAGTVNPDGTVTLTADELDGLTITPPADYSGSFDLGVTATSTDGTDTASVSDSISVSVEGEADAPALDVTDASGTEDTAIALDIDAGLTDSGEVLSITVSNIPEGATLSAGTVNPDGTVTLTADELDGLTITPPADYSGSFDLGVTATSTDGTDTASVSDSISVSVEGEADAPTLGVTDATGTEDTAIALEIDAGLTDSGEVLSVTVSNIPEGATLSAGTVNPDGTVTLTADELDGLTITPPTDYSGSFDLGITATSADGTDTASVSDTISVSVEGEADAPTLDVVDATGTEDSPIALDIDAGLTDSGEVLSVTVSNIPEGATLSAGTVNPDGTVTLTADELDGLTITPPTDYSGSFDLGITATSADGTDTASVSDTLTVDVTGEADAPTLDVADAIGTEDSPIALDIDAGLTDSGEVLSVTVSNIPEGATLSAGTVNPDGTVTLTADELNGLTITPPADYSGSFDLGVTATSADGTDTASVSDTLTVDVTGEADAPTLDVADAIGTEDSPIALDIDAGLTDSGEVLSVTVSNIPEGATLSAGTVNPDGTVTLTADELDGLTITPPADYSGSFDLGVTATSTDGTDTASVSDSISVSVEGEADAPALDVTDASGTEDTAIALDIDAGLTDSGEVLSITVSNIPEGATLSAGTVNPDGTVTLTADELDGLTITPPADYSGSFDLGVTATSTDGTDTASVSDSISVSVEGEADAPTLGVTDATGTEDTAIALEIDAGLTDSGEVLSVTVSNIPEGATLSAGTVNPDGTVTLTADELDGLTITPPTDYSGSFDLGVTATSADGTDTASVSDTLTVDVTGEADAPTLDVTDAAGTEDTAIALDIDAGLTDSGEVLSVTVSNIPEGATLSVGTVNPDGTVTLTADELDGLTITPPADYSGSFDLGVTATSTDGTDTATTSDTLNVSVEGEADAPTLGVTDATGTEDTAIALDVDAALTDSSEVLSVTVSNIPEGATLSAGTVNPDGTVTLTADELDGLTITPPADYSGSFDLGVTATSTDGTDTATTSDTLNVSVEGEADAPTLGVTDATGTEDTAIALDIDAGLTDAGEVLSVTVSNIPEGATLSAGTVNPDGTVTLTADELDGLTITPPADYSGSFDLGVTATSTDGTDTATTSDTLNVSVEGEADAPTLGVTDATGTEDTAIALDIDAGLTDSGEVLSVTVSNIPEGATLSAGTVNPDSTVTLTADELDGLTITPPADYSGSFDLGVTATSTDGTDTASVSDTISVSVEGEADAPTLDVADASGTEDTAIALDVDAALTDSSEVLSVTVSNIPEGATLSAGTVNPDGTVTLTADELDGLTITPPADYSGSFDLGVTATSADGTDTASVSDTLTVDVTGEADAPTLDVADAAGTEDTAIALDIDAGLTDAGEVLSVTVSNIPEGATLSAGTVNPDGTVTLTADELDGLTITPPADYSGSFDLGVTATSTDGTDTASVSDTISVSVEGEADAPTLDVTDAAGTEDSPIALDIDAGLTDSDEVLSVTVSNIPEGATLSAGTVNPDGTVTLTADELDGLTITPPADYSGSFDLGVTATSADGTDTASVSDTLTVDVTGEADAPTLDVADAAGTEDTAIALDIDAGLTDSGEVLSVTVSNIPEGATLSAGTVNPDGTVTLTADELDGLTITPPADYSGSFDLGVTATSTDGTDTASVSDTISVSVEGEADAPTLGVTDASGTEDTAIALDIDAGLTDAGEVLSVTVSNIPEGATLSAGTVNPDGTVTLTADELDGLTITPPADYSGSFDLGVTATSTDGTDTATTSDTLNVSVEGEADAPTLGVTDATGTEDTAIALDVDAALTDSSEVLSVTVSNIPEGATLSAGTVNPDGTVTLTADELDGLTITPPADYSGSFDLGVTATSADGTDTASVSDTLTVDVTGEADAPTLDVADAAGTEDTAIALDIDAGLTDAGEVLSVTVSNIPEGATLSAGTVNPDGTVTLTADELDGLTITPPADYSGSFDLGVTATSTDGTDTASVSDTISVSVEGEADAPTLDVADASGTEDTAIALDVDAALTDSSEVLSVTVSNIPEGATLSAGTVNPDSTVTLTADELDGLTITPPADYSGSFDLGVTATSTDGTDTASVSDTISVSVEGEADAPTLDVADASGTEDTAIALDVDAALTDSSEVLSVTVSNIPEGATLSAGTVNPDGTVTLTADELDGLTITPPADYSGSFDLGVTATSADGTDTASVSDTLTVDVTGEADAPTLDVADAAGTEDTAIALDIDAGLTDAGEVLSVTVSNIPEGATLSAGTVNPDGTVTLTADELDGLTITPPADYSGSFDLGVTATSTDGTDTASVSDTISVSVEGEADAPTLDVTDAAGTEDSPIALDIDAGLTDSDEVLSVTVSNIPEGATLSAGTVNPDGTVTLTADELDGLTITPPADYSGSFDLGVTATSADGTDTASVSDTLTVDVTGEADAPTLDVADAIGTEDSPIALDIDAGLTDSGEVLSVTVSNIPEGATLSAGTVNPDGTVTLTADELDGLTITPPADYSGSFDLGITATSTDGTDTASVSDTLTVDVTGEADAPTLGVTDASGTEDTPIALDIDAGLTDSGEVLSVTVSNIPEGATLSAGTVNPDGTVTLTADELDGLTITPPADYSGSFDLGVTATSTYGTDTVSISDTVSLQVNPVADAPTLSVSIGEGIATGADGGSGQNDFVDDGRTNHQGTDGDETYVIDRDMNMNENIDLRGGNDDVVLNGDTNLGNNIRLGDGNDSLTINGNIGQTSALDGGSGDDVLYLGKPSASYSLQNFTDNQGVINTQIIDLDTGQMLTVNQIEAISFGDGVVVGNADLVQSSEPSVITYPVTIDAALNDADGSETLSINVTGLPEGVTLNAGSLNSDGSWTLEPAELDGLTLTTPSDFRGSIDLTVTATATDGADTKSVSTTQSISVEDQADAPTLDVTSATGNEDSAIALDIDAGLTDANEVLSVTVSNIPEGATLSAGTVNPDGTVTLTADELNGLTITPPADYSGSFDLGVTATSTDGTDTASASATLNINVVGVADTPILNVTDASGNGNDPISIDIEAGLNDSSEILSVTISNIPNGATFNKGTLNTDGTVTLSADELDGLTITSPDWSVDNFELSVTATSTDENDTASLTEILTVNIENDNTPGEVVTGSNKPDIINTGSGDDIIYAGNAPDTVNSGAGDDTIFGENGTDILEGGTGNDTLFGGHGKDTLDGGEGNDILFGGQSNDLLTGSASDQLYGENNNDEIRYTVDLSSNPIGVVDGGSGNDTLKLYLTSDQLAEGGVRDALQALQDHIDGGDNDSITLDVLALKVVDIETLEIHVDGVPVNLDDLISASSPTLNVSNAAGNEDTAIALDIDAALAGSAEALSVTIGNIPEGATLSAGTANTNGTVTLTADELNGLTITPPADYSGSFDLDISATSTEGGDTASASETLNISVAGVADTPTLNVTDASGNGSDPISIDIDAGLSDSSEILSVTIGNIPNGATFNNGTVNADGTVTLTADQLDGLTVTMPNNCVDNCELTITATATDGSDSTSVNGTLNIDISNTPGYIAHGTWWSDHIAMGDGGDLVFAHSGNDTVLAGGGDDTVYGDSGHDVIQGETGDDTLYGGSGADTLDGGEGTDILAGGSWNDTLTGSGPDRLYGESDNDELNYTVDLTSDEIGVVDGGWNYDVLKLHLTSDQLNSDGVRDALQALQSHVESGSSHSITLDALNLKIDDIETVELYLDGEVVAFDALPVAAPTLNVALPGVVLEDASTPLTIDVGVLAPGELLEVTIEGLTSDQTLSAGVLNPDGSWTLTGDELAGLTITALEPGSGLLQVTATVNDPITGTSNSSLAEINLEVLNVADAPILNLGLPGIVLENNATPLTIDVGVLAPGELLEVTIEGLTSDQTLSAGVLNPDGSWTLTGDELAGLTITALEPGSGVLQVTATVNDPITGTSNSSLAEINLEVLNVADAPILNLGLPGIVLENNATPLTIDVGVLAPGEVLEVTIEGLTSDQTLSAGVLNPDGSWTLTGDELAGLTITALEPGSGLLQVTATVNDPITGTSNSSLAEISLEVLNVADAPILNLGLPGIVVEDSPSPLTIDVGVLAPDELLEVTVEGLSSDQTLSAGELNPDGSWSLTGDELTDLTITALEPGSSVLQITATISDPVSGTSNSSLAEINLEVLNVVDTPVIDIDIPSIAIEDNATPLTITVSDLAVTEELSVTIDGVDNGATLNSGTLNPDGSYSLELADLVGLTITPETADDLHLTVTASVSDTSSATNAETSATIDIDVESNPIDPLI